uniref:FZ domain-containing protein n=1 Tax=Panagrellus redivivus TaxID=6233 RepID=A0A7E4UTR7_PANRE
MHVGGGHRLRINSRFAVRFGVILLLVLVVMTYIIVRNDACSEFSDNEEEQCVPWWTSGSNVDVVKDDTIEDIVDKPGKASQRRLHRHIHPKDLDYMLF